jgi:hypothetical protein
MQASQLLITEIDSSDGRATDPIERPPHPFTPLEIERYDRLYILMRLLLKPNCIENKKDISDIVAYLRNLNFSQKSNKDKPNKEFIFLLNKYLKHKNLVEKDLRQISINLLRLEHFEFLKTRPQLRNKIQNLNALIIKKRILFAPEFTSQLKGINIFPRKYHLSVGDKLYRYAIAINAGVGSSGVVIGFVTSFTLAIPVVGAFVGFSVILGGLITKHFLQSFREEDRFFSEEVLNHKRNLSLLAGKEANLRLKCYSRINQILNLLEEFKDCDFTKLKDKNTLESLRAAAKQNNPIKELDDYIDNRLKTISKYLATSKETKDFRVPKRSTIYTRVFHSKHWGPLLNFLGSTGTIFGVTKMVLGLVGVTALLGSPLLLGALVGGVAIGFSFGVALKHWSFNRKSDTRKKEMDLLSDNKFENLEIKCDKLKFLKQKLKTTLAKMEESIAMRAAKIANPNLANAVKMTIENALSETQDFNSQPSKAGLFAIRHEVLASPHSISLISHSGLPAARRHNTPR